MNTWATILAASAACYGLKLAGHSLPAGALNDPRVQRIAVLLPVALLPALIALQTFARDGELTVDAHLAGVAVAIVAQLLRAPFLVVVVAGGAAAALVRLAA
jgi:uncharacterized membrane protein